MGLLDRIGADRVVSFRDGGSEGGEGSILISDRGVGERKRSEVPTLIKGTEIGQALTVGASEWQGKR